jgi:hypothetical protein
VSAAAVRVQAVQTLIDLADGDYDPATVAGHGPARQVLWRRALVATKDDPAGRALLDKAWAICSGDTATLIDVAADGGLDGVPIPTVEQVAEALGTMFDEVA